MRYNRLGRSGLKVSELAFGSWLTFGADLDVEGAKQCMRRAFELGVNFFDNAEAYGKGQSEVVMGEVLKAFRREDLVISTKIFWGGSGPNDTGLSWKHLVEGTKAALKRLQLDYVDLLFAHRPDPNTPLDETVRAMDHLVREGYVFYWGTSEWPAVMIEEAYQLSTDLLTMPPTMEQPQYNLLVRERVEREYAPLFANYGMGTTIWSPLASGILTGKYNDGVPANSRLAQHEWLKEKLTPEVVGQVKRLSAIADEIGCSLAQLSIAWCLKNPQVSSVILGATTVKQLEENLKALEFTDHLTGEVLETIDVALGPA